MLQYKGKNTKVIKAVGDANKLLNGDKGFYASVVNNKPYDMSNVTNKKLAWLMKKHHVESNVNVVLYCYWNPFSKMKAVFKPSKPDNIYIVKKYAKNASTHSLVGTLIHEFIHAVDHKYIEYTFGHGNNSRVGKENTAPYRIGTMAKYISEAYYK